jgi:hypothetical protein
VVRKKFFLDELGADVLHVVDEWRVVIVVDAVVSVFTGAVKNAFGGNAFGGNAFGADAMTEVDVDGG